MKWKEEEQKQSIKTIHQLCVFLISNDFSAEEMSDVHLFAPMTEMRWFLRDKIQVGFYMWWCISLYIFEFWFSLTTTKIHHGHSLL